MLVFLHIPRTGGSTFYSVLRSVFGEEHCRFGKTGAAGEIRSLIKYAANKEVEAIGGHGLLKDFKKFYGKARFYTIVRHPIRRLVSIYNYAAAMPGHWLHKECLTQDINEFIEAIAEDPKFSEHKGLLLNGSAYFLSDGECSAEKSIEAIDDHFADVGVTYLYPKFISRFCKSNGLYLPGEVDKTNTSPIYKATPEDINDDMKKLCLELMQPDFQLFKHAEKKFNS